MFITLKNGDCSAMVDSFGAQLMSLQREGREYLWQGDERWWKGRAPVLFPIVGRLRDNCTEINGTLCTIRRHGFAGSMEFAVAEQSEASVTLEISDTEDTRRQYPFSFSFRVSYRLCENSLVTSFRTENRGGQAMPFAVGGHPAFRVPQDSNETFEDWFLEFEQPETALCPDVVIEEGLIDFSNRRILLKEERRLPLRHELFVRDALIFDSLRSKKVALKSGITGHGLEMDFSGFPMLGIWSAEGNAPFVALEPWHGCATAVQEDDRFESKRLLRLLLPGNALEDQFRVALF